MQRQSARRSGHPHSTRHGSFPEKWLAEKYFQKGKENSPWSQNVGDKRTKPHMGTSLLGSAPAVSWAEGVCCKCPEQTKLGIFILQLPGMLSHP